MNEKKTALETPLQPPVKHVIEVEVCPECKGTGRVEVCSDERGDYMSNCYVCSRRGVIFTYTDPRTGRKQRINIGHC